MTTLAKQINEILTEAFCFEGDDHREFVEALCKRVLQVVAESRIEDLARYNATYDMTRADGE